MWWYIYIGVPERLQFHPVLTFPPPWRGVVEHGTGVPERVRQLQVLEHQGEREPSAHLREHRHRGRQLRRERRHFGERGLGLGSGSG